MKKICARFFLVLILPLLLFKSAAASGNDKYYEANRMSYYAPQLLPSVADAANKILFLQPHIYAQYGKMLIVSKRVTVDQNGINFVFATPGNISYDEHTESISVADAAEIESNLSHTFPGYYYVQVGCTDSLPLVYTDSIERAHMLEDAILTLEVASGRINFFASDVDLFSVPDKELKSLKRDVAFTVIVTEKAGPAETAGLKSGDIIVGLNGGSARGIWPILGTGVQNSPAGYTAHLSILRNKTPLEIDVTYKALWTAQQLAALQATDPNAVHPSATLRAAPVVAPTPANGVILGVHAHNITPSEAQAAGIADAQGIFVEQIAAGSLAEQAKILPGDVILALDGKPAVTLEAMRAILQNGAPSNIKVWRHGEAVSLTVSQSL